MKICSCCNLEKEDSEFYTRKNRKSGYTSMCKDCYAKYMQARRITLMDLINTYKESKGCAKCGITKGYLLDFHHKDPSKKDFTISEHTRKTYKNLIPELEKCEILCANCHREYHYLNKKTGIDLNKYLEN